MTPGREEFRFRGADDFVRLDGLCVDLLSAFYGWVQRGGVSAEEATPLAHAADRYLRDFLADILETGPTDASAATARQYLGNWYIVNTLDPTHGEVDLILRSFRLLYRFLADADLLGDEALREAEEALSDEAFFHQRLEDFWDLTPDGISAWRSVDDYRRSSSVHSRAPSS